MGNIILKYQSSFDMVWPNGAQQHRDFGNKVFWHLNYTSPCNIWRKIKIMRDVIGVEVRNRKWKIVNMRRKRN